MLRSQLDWPRLLLSVVGRGIVWAERNYNNDNILSHPSLPPSSLTGSAISTDNQSKCLLGKHCNDDQPGRDFHLNMKLNFSGKLLWKLLKTADDKMMKSFPTRHFLHQFMPRLVNKK